MLLSRAGRLNSNMTAIADAAIVAALILDIISMYNSRGIEVDLDSLSEAIENEKARRDEINKRLFKKNDNE